MSDWNWKNFSPDEFKCSHCGVYLTVPEFMDRLQSLRTEYGKPMKITSGYRCPDHNTSVSHTGAAGPHTTGRAVDIQVSGQDAYTLLLLALKHGFTGVGISQKGPHGARFLHLDDIQNETRPAIWSY